MSHSYPSPPQSNSDHGSVHDTDDLFDIATFDNAIREASVRASTARSKVFDRPSNGGPEQATHNILRNHAKSRTQVADKTRLKATAADSAHLVDVSGQTMAELEEFLEHDRLEQHPTTLLIPRSNFVDDQLDRELLQVGAFELDTISTPDEINSLNANDYQETTPFGFSTNAYEFSAPPIHVVNPADLLSDIIPPPLAPVKAQMPSRVPTGNKPAKCMCCHTLTHKSGDPACFRVKAAILPLCGHFVCQSCITHYYDLKGEYNSCLYCPMCDSFSGSLSISDTSLPTLSRDLHYLLYKARQLPPAYLAVQPVSINVEDASVVLKGVLEIVAAELGSDTLYTTASLPTDRFYTSLEASLQARRMNDVTSPEELRIVLLACIERRAVDELSRWYGRVWLRSQFRHRRQTYQWHKLKAALERHWAHNTEMQVMQAWTVIVHGVVGVLTLRWEHRLDAMLRSVDCTASGD